MERDIYAKNEWDDQSIRNEYFADLNMVYRITDNFEWNVINRTYFRKLNFEENTRQNNWFYETDLNYKLNLHTQVSQYYTVLSLKNNKRNWKSNNQSFYRESEEKKISYGALWKYPLIDTLSVEIANSILQNFHSETSQSMDYDLVMNSYSIYSVKNYKRHSFYNTMQIYQGELVNIHSGQSAYNHKKMSYIWNPETDLYLSRHFRLVNKYRMRADYEDYIWTEFIKDRFYRSLSGEWGIRFLQSNLMAFWLYDNFSIYGAFSLEHIETAVKEDGMWFRNSSEYQRNYLLSLDYQKRNFLLRVKPVVKYYNRTFESEIQTDATLNLQNFQIITSINPVGRQFNKMIWRFNLFVQYGF
jgi:hypothetical protein